MDDFGTIINPMIVEGQVQGGVAQGIGQALLEGAHYDRDSGQLLTGSYMDYNMPKAANMPHIENFKLGFTYHQVPVESFGHEGLRRGRSHCGTSRRDQRHHQCPRGARHCHAGNAAHRVECHAAHETRRRIRGQKMENFNYHRPATVNAAVALLKKSKGGSYMAGGHTLLPTMKQGLASPSRHHRPHGHQGLLRNHGRRNQPW